MKDFREGSQSARDPFLGSTGASSASQGLSVPGGHSSSTLSSASTEHLHQHQHEISITDPYYGMSPSGAVITNSFENLSVSDQQQHQSLPSAVSSNASISSVPPSSGSPQVSRKFAKTWKTMGDKTKNKTRVILKRWQTLANGQAQFRKHPHPKATSNDASQLCTAEQTSENCDSVDSTHFSSFRSGQVGDQQRSHSKGSWSVHIWCKLNEFLLETQLYSHTLISSLERNTIKITISKRSIVIGVR